MKKYRANLVDIFKRSVYPAEICVQNGRILSVYEIDGPAEKYILPGFIDAHVHIESSMVTPVEFSREAVKHGTVGSVSDPHEIANVLGIQGVDFMIENSRHTAMKILFGAPSCVPATSFESSGATIDAKGVEELLRRPEIGFLSEMMNYPGVVYGDGEVVEKISLALKNDMPIDGHAPGLRGKDLKIYAESGITTDHECFTQEEAEEKIFHGMSILIREGSGAKNFEALIPLLEKHPDRIMFCTDDLHPDDLMEGHINVLVKRALDLGYNLFDVLRAASYNANEHYKLNIGMLRPGDAADFIVADSLTNLTVLSTFINGKEVFSDGEVHIKSIKGETPNKFNARNIKASDLKIEAKKNHIKVIQAIDGELITRKKVFQARIVDGCIQEDIKLDVLKIVVVNRYKQIEPALAFINGFNLRKGALASSIAHDSHNIICVGTSDKEIAETINWIIDNKGGIAVHDGKMVSGLPLDIAGILSSDTVENAAEKYKALSGIAKSNGSDLKAPFMTLAFMSLLVIPELKLSDKGLFDGNSFEFTSLFDELA